MKGNTSVYESTILPASVQNNDKGRQNYRWYRGLFPRQTTVIAAFTWMEYFEKGKNKTNIFFELERELCESEKKWTNFMGFAIFREPRSFFLKLTVKLALQI